MVGGLGAIAIIAPFPIGEASESPYELVAMIFAYTELPYCKLNGAANKTVYGMLQVKD